MPLTCHATLPWTTLIAATAAAAAHGDADEDGSTQDSQGNNQSFKVHWITQEEDK